MAFKILSRAPPQFGLRNTSVRGVIYSDGNSPARCATWTWALLGW